MSRPKFLLIVLPLVITPLMLLYSHRFARSPWDQDLAMDIAVTFLGIPLTVGFVDWLLRRHEQEEWAPVNQFAAVQAIRAASSIVDSVFRRLEIQREDAEAALGGLTYIDMSERWMGDMDWYWRSGAKQDITVLNAILLPRVHLDAKGLTSPLRYSDWSDFEAELIAAHSATARIATTYPRIDRKLQLSLFNLNRAVERALKPFEVRRAPHEGTTEIGWDFVARDSLTIVLSATAAVLQDAVAAVKPLE